jgi:hypothetical protein
MGPPMAQEGAAAIALAEFNRRHESTTARDEKG